MTTLAVIIPTLNEAEHLRLLLQQLKAQEGVQLSIVVVDGGSTDATIDIAREFGVAIIHTVPRRGRQMNMGVMARNSCVYMLFLHADSTLPDRRLLSRSLACLQQEEGAVGQPPVAGHYGLDFNTKDSKLRSRLGYFERKSRLNRPGTFNGDQGLLIRGIDFGLLGEFSEEMNFLEDRDFAERLLKVGKFITLPGSLGTSARRFETEGLTRRVILNALILCMHELHLSSFFARASGLYRQQQDTGRLRLAPFLGLAFITLVRGTPISVLKRLYLLGRYACHNAWQLSFYIGGEKWLTPYDRYCRPLIANPLGYSAVALLALPCLVLGYLVARLLDPRKS